MNPAVQRQNTTNKTNPRWKSIKIPLDFLPKMRISKDPKLSAVARVHDLVPTLPGSFILSLAPIAWCSFSVEFGRMSVAVKINPEGKPPPRTLYYFYVFVILFSKLYNSLLNFKGVTRVSNFFGKINQPYPDPCMKYLSTFGRRQI